MDKKILGLWKEYGWHKGATSIKEDIHEYLPGLFSPLNQVVDYLRNGIGLIGIRTVERCYFTGNFLTAPHARTDGAYIWSDEYTYYVKLGVIEVNEIFLEHMRENQFKVPSKEDLGMETLISLQKKISDQIR